MTAPSRGRWAEVLFFVLGAIICTLVVITDGTPTQNPEDWSVTENDATMGIIAGLTCLGLLALAAVRRFKPALLSPVVKKALKVLAVLLVIAGGFTYFYTSRAVAKIRYPKTWDSYHYFVGSKYFRELGYNNLYACHALADSQRRRPKYSRRDGIRDLDTYRIKRVGSVLRDAEELCSTFSEERWEEFQHDTAFFDSYNIKRVIRDHGYNGTPFHAVVAGNLAQLPEVRWEGLVRISFIDIMGLSIMLSVVAWAFGWKVAFLFALFLFTNFADRFTYIGASYFRYQWMVALGIGLALLKKQKYGPSAAFITLAAMLNVFPLLFFGGIGAKMVHKLVKTRKLDPNYKTFVSWAVVATLAFGGISLMQPRHIHNYTQFLDNMSRHSALLTTSRIGFQYNFHYRGEVTRDDPRVSYEQKAEDLNKIRIPYMLVVVFVLTMGLFVILKLDDLRATILMGFLLFFMLFSTVEYYYAVSAVLVLFWADDIDKGRPRAKIFLALLFGLLALLYAVWSQNPWLLFANNHMMSALFTIYLGAVLAYFWFIQSKEKDLDEEGEAKDGWREKLTAGARRLWDKVARLPMTVKVGSVVVVALVVAGVFAFRGREPEVVHRPHHGPYSTLFAAGDTVLARRMHHHLYENGPRSPLRDVADLVSGADIAMANLESVVALGGDLYPKGNRNPFYFKGRPELLDILTSVGFDLVTTANNHAMDYGPEALAQEGEILAASGIARAGSGKNLAEASRPALIKTSEMTVAVISLFVGADEIGAGPDAPGVFQVRSEGDVVAALDGPYKQARRHADVVVLSPHWGANLAKNPTGSRVELAHELIDMGFDGILGHSAHLIQGVEVYKGRPIVYDMGNFLADWVSSGRMKRQAGFLLQFNREGFTELRIIPLEADYGAVHLARGSDAEEVREIIERQSEELDDDIHFETDGEALVVPLWPPERRSERPEPSDRVHLAGSTKAVPERFTEARSSVFLDEPPAYDADFPDVPMQSGVDVIGAKTVDVVHRGSGFLVEVALKVREKMPGRWDGVVIARRRGGDGEFEYPHPISHGAADPERWSAGDIVLDRICVRQSGNVEPGTWDLYWALRKRRPREWVFARPAEGGEPRPVKIGSVRIVDGGVSRRASGIDWNGEE